MPKCAWYHLGKAVLQILCQKSVSWLQTKHKQRVWYSAIEYNYFFLRETSNIFPEFKHAFSALYNSLQYERDWGVTEASTSLRMCSLEHCTFQSHPPGRPASLTGPSQDRTRSLDWNTNRFNSFIQVLISCVTWLPMPCQSDERDQIAPSPPQAAFTSPTKAIGNDGASHAGTDAREIEA